MFRRAPKRQLSLPPIEETAPEVVAYTSSKSKEHKAEVDTAAAVTDQDDIISSMAVAEHKIDHRSRRTTASNPGPEWAIQVHQGQVMEEQRKYQEVFDENQSQRKHILYLQNQVHHMSVERQHLQNAHAELQQDHRDQLRQFKKMDKQYKDLDRKYMEHVRTLQVTRDDRSTINKQLGVVSSTIEYLVITGKGKGSAKLNRAAAIQHFRNSGLLETFPVQERQLESFHLNLFMESAMMTVLVRRLFLRPLPCIFDRSREFEEICKWVQARGSRAAERWRQELCILIAQEGKEMARRREKEVDEAIVELKDLFSSVYGNVDTSISDKIKGLCDIAFDLSYAMFGMESRVYPASIGHATPFNENYMTMAMRSNPRGSVSLIVFPSFLDSNNKLYFKSKVWCN